MVIIRSHWEKDHNGKIQEMRVRILDEEIRYSWFAQSIKRTGDDGYQFTAIDWDEFDNKSELQITLTREDVEALKDMIAKGLI